MRVRVIHALVRADLRRRRGWDDRAWGVPICQAYLAYTLVEFALIPVRSMRQVGAPYLPHEEAASYARWRYLGPPARHRRGPAAARRRRAGTRSRRSTCSPARPSTTTAGAWSPPSTPTSWCPRSRSWSRRRLRRSRPTVVHGDRAAVPRRRDRRRAGHPAHPVRRPWSTPLRPGARSRSTRLLDRVASPCPARPAAASATGAAGRPAAPRWGVQHDLVDASPAAATDPARGRPDGQG